MQLWMGSSRSQIVSRKFLSARVDWGGAIFSPPNRSVGVEMDFSAQPVLFPGRDVPILRFFKGNFFMTVYSTGSFLGGLGAEFRLVNSTSFDWMGLEEVIFRGCLQVGLLNGGIDVAGSLGFKVYFCLFVFHVVCHSLLTFSSRGRGFHEQTTRSLGESL